MKLNDFKKELLKDKRFREEYYSRDLAFDISAMISEARALKGVTQKELARKMGTKQPSIARVENGSSLPSLAFLEKMANALGTHLIPPKFGFMENSFNQYNSFSYLLTKLDAQMDNVVRSSKTEHTKDIEIVR